MRGTIRALIWSFSGSGIGAREEAFDSSGAAGAHRRRRWFLKLTAAA